MSFNLRLFILDINRSEIYVIQMNSKISAEIIIILDLRSLKNDKTYIIGSQSLIQTKINEKCESIQIERYTRIV
jgi:hypothetical protein